MKGAFAAAVLLAGACVMVFPCPQALAANAPSQSALRSPVIAGKDAIQVRWEKVERADGYRVHRLGEGGSLKRAGTAPSGGRTSLVVKHLKRGRTYAFTVESWLCSPSSYTRSGTWRARGKHRFWSLYYSSYSQWTMTVHNPILFHTVPYRRYGSRTSLEVSAYNKLGTPASQGCVRMSCDGMRWFYDNCPNGTKVVIYRSAKAGPFGKPRLQKIPGWHTWDPTDPTCKSLCTKHGCH